MHPLGPTPSLLPWIIALDHRPDEERRLSQLMALAESRGSESSWISRTWNRLSGRATPSASPGPLDCCGAG